MRVGFDGKSQGSLRMIPFMAMNASEKSSVVGDMDKLKMNALELMNLLSVSRVENIVPAVTEAVELFREGATY